MLVIETHFKIVCKKTDRVTTSGTTSENEWQPVTKNRKDLQWVAVSVNLSFFQIREEPSTKHPKENSLNLEEGLFN